MQRSPPDKSKYTKADMCPKVPETQIQIHKHKYTNTYVKNIKIKLCKAQGCGGSTYFRCGLSEIIKKVKETPHLHTGWSFSIPKKMSPYNTSDQDIRMCSRDPCIQKIGAIAVKLMEKLSADR